MGPLLQGLGHGASRGATRPHWLSTSSELLPGCSVVGKRREDHSKSQFPEPSGEPHVVGTGMQNALGGRRCSLPQRVLHCTPGVPGCSGLPGSAALHPFPEPRAGHLTDAVPRCLPPRGFSDGLGWALGLVDIGLFLHVHKMASGLWVRGSRGVVLLDLEPHIAPTLLPPPPRERRPIPL